VLQCSGDFVGCGAAIRRQSRSPRKRQHALCPIHTMQIFKSWRRGALRLDGFWASCSQPCPSARKKPRKFRLRTEPFVARSYLSKEVVPGTGWRPRGYLNGYWARQAMGQQLQPWRSEGSQRMWLSMLVDTMEQICRPSFRNSSCNPSVLTALEAQLARPAAPYCHGASSFSLRN
jgi:hypothetical protein